MQIDPHGRVGIGRTEPLRWRRRGWRGIIWHTFFLSVSGGLLILTANVSGQAWLAAFFGLLSGINVMTLAHQIELQMVDAR